jgi:hypothetical protein
MEIRTVPRDEAFTLSMNDGFAGLFEGPPWRLAWYNRREERMEIRPAPREVKSAEDAEAWAHEYLTLNWVN